VVTNQRQQNEILDRLIRIEKNIDRQGNKRSLSRKQKRHLRKLHKQMWQNRSGSYRYKNGGNIVRTAGILLSIIVIIGMGVLFSGLVTSAGEIKQNRQDIASLTADIQAIGEDIDNLEVKFDEFMYKNLDLMLEMKQTIDNTVKDQSIHVSLTDVGNAAATADPANTASQSSDASPSISTPEDNSENNKNKDFNKEK